MNLNHLRAFVTTARLLNFTRAAEKLHLSQPAISGQIRALEEEIGVSLFQRDGKKVALTETGARLLDKAEAVLDAAAAFLDRADSLRTAPPRHLRLGIIIGAEVLRIGKTLARLNASDPHLRIDVQQGLSGWVIAGLRSGQLDAGFFLGPNLPGDVDATELTRLTYLVAAPAAWAGEIGRADLADIARMPWIWTPENGSYPHIVRDLFSGHHLTPMKIIEADREATIVNLVASGIGLCILREEVVRAIARDDRIVVWEKGRREVPLYFVTRPDPDAPLRTLRTAVMEEWGVRPDAERAA
ncbi:DNA-binding transcriptional LysR family regulator [Pseudochelatococcus lubricantis]|uniref:DNA-binding transcriptional LysR family regulator n=1 Tax=Pseudochelatococcus lubricantis TaxID=1538102 RepID=A0ABX0V6N1_9HYPH|nr:LysR family transcriptional regulator [Pseudochelatococcus lubricantis]NIJ58791.1 DNA-binding transcriptional LysR family regulator [Pseudochelatococcus lubricantis]